MEKLNNQICSGILQNCNKNQAEKMTTKKDNEIIKTIEEIKAKDDRKPWSVFGDVYWI